MADNATLHNRYQAESAAAITQKKAVDAAVQALSVAMGAYNKTCDDALKIFRQVPAEGQPWLEQFIAPLPKPITEITVPAPTLAKVSGEISEQPEEPGIARDPKIDPKKTR